MCLSRVSCRPCVLFACLGFHLPVACVLSVCLGFHLPVACVLSVCLGFHLPVMLFCLLVQNGRKEELSIERPFREFIPRNFFFGRVKTDSGGFCCDGLAGLLLYREGDIYTEYKPDFYSEKSDIAIDIGFSLRIWQILVCYYIYNSTVKKLKQLPPKADNKTKGDTNNE